MDRLPPLKSLVYFESAARLQSFTRASLELSVTQGAVSRQIRSLEDFLGKALFNRKQRQVFLTDDGHNYYLDIANIIQQLKASTEKLIAPSHPDPVTLVTSSALASMYLLPRIPDFRRQHKDIEIRIIAGSKTIKRRKLTADRLLLDVPCSGLGVLKRNPDAKWRDTVERLPILIELQKHILQSYSRLVKVGGILIYATCSIMPDENRHQVDAFLAANAQFKLLDDETISVADSGFDGFYMARLERITQ